MEKTVAQLTARALEKIGERLERIEAHQIGTDLLLAAIMETHPDRTGVLDALDRTLDPQLAATSNNPRTAQAAQQRMRLLLDTWRRQDQQPESGE